MSTATAETPTKQNSLPPLSTSPATKPSALPPVNPAPKARPTVPPTGALDFAAVSDDGAGERIVIYAPGGAGKTTLATLLPGPIAFFDLDKSLAHLKRAGKPMDHIFTVGAPTFAEITSRLNSPGWDSIKTIVIDSFSELEMLAAEHVCKTAPGKGRATGEIGSLEDFGYGKGFRFLYDELDKLLMALQRHADAGRNVVLICHEVVNTIKNADGSNYISVEPRILKTDKNNFLDRVKGWADHILFIRYDVAVKEGKAIGRGTRTIYVSPTPAYLAKSRDLRDPVECIEGDATIWNKIFATKGESK